jgi:hypothetical protein
MAELEQSYYVSGVAVILVRDGHGVHWECSKCGCDCKHVLQVAAWMTLESWVQNPMNEELH